VTNRDRIATFGAAWPVDFADRAAVHAHPGG
jgi:hypothetical protein